METNNDNEEFLGFSINLDLFYYSAEGGFQPPHFSRGVLFLDNYHFITMLAKDPDGLGSRLIMNDLLDPVLLFCSSRGRRRGALWPDSGSEHDMRPLRGHR